MIFKSAICDQNYLAMLNAYGAYKDDVPIGIIATRSEGKHIALFFVDGKYHKLSSAFESMTQGIWGERGVCRISNKV